MLVRWIIPYPNEHACRLREPDDFQANSFRRMSRTHEGKKYSVIIGRLKGETSTTEQAYRYNKDTWTASEARSHCDDHDGTFEAASEEEESKNQRTFATMASTYSRIWAIIPEVLYSVAQFFDERIGREIAFELNESEIEAARIKRASQFRDIRGNVAILPILGVISQRHNLFSWLLGGTSTTSFAVEFQKVVTDSSIGAVLLDIDSPGGSVYGVHELAETVYQARAKKPIIACVNSLCASAAYWIGAAADEVIVTPSGELGSVGVVAIHTDISEAERQLGIRTTLIYAGSYKTEANPHEPLQDSARAAIQERVDDYYEMFITDLSRFRNVSESKVRREFGQGRIVGAEEAVRLKMADKVGTPEMVIRDIRAPSDKLAMNRNRMELAKLS